MRLILSFFIDACLIFVSCRDILSVIVRSYPGIFSADSVKLSRGEFLPETKQQTGLSIHIYISWRIFFSVKLAGIVLNAAVGIYVFSERIRSISTHNNRRCIFSLPLRVRVYLNFYPRVAIKDAYFYRTACTWD